jgi:hypothetical protein
MVNFCHTPSWKIANSGAAARQIEWKPAERDREAADKPEGSGNQPDVCFSGRKINRYTCRLFF